MDMVDYEDKLLIILDNGELTVINKSSNDPDSTMELPLKSSTPVSISKLNDSLIIGWTNGVTFYAKFDDIKNPIEIPKPPFLGENSVEPPENHEYPDSRVVKAFGNRIAVLFNDKTMVWYEVGEDNDISINHINKNHFGGVYSIDCYPPASNAYQFAFLTGSVDRTLRRWVANINPDDLSCQVNEDKIGLLCDNFDHLKTKNESEEGVELGKIRTITLSKDEDLPHIVCGDSGGYLWVFDANKMSLLSIFEAHQSEILGIEFSPIDDFRDWRHQKLATCSKDHTIKIFDAKENYEEVKVLKCHESAVIGWKYIEDEKDSDLKLISADAKGNLRTVSIDEDCKFSEPVKKTLHKNKIFSITTSEESIILGMEKKLQLAQVRTDNSIICEKDLAPKATYTREYIKLETDDVSLYVVAWSKKKRDVNFIEMKTGTVVHSFSWGEVITGLKYSPNYKFLLTSTNTGWVYIWRVPSNIEREIMFKSNQKALRITETPRANKIVSKLDGFAMFAQNSSDEKEERKAWGKTKEKKQTQEPINRGSIPDWARSTVNVNDFDVEEDNNLDNFTMRNKTNDPFDKLQETVTDDEEEEKHVDALPSVFDDFVTNAEQSEVHSDTDNAFNFENPVDGNARVNSKDILTRQSRIGDFLRNSVFEKEQKRMTVISPLPQYSLLSSEKQQMNKPFNNVIQENEKEDNENSNIRSKHKHEDKFEKKAINNTVEMEKALNHGMSIKQKNSRNIGIIWI